MDRMKCYHMSNSPIKKHEGKLVVPRHFPPRFTICGYVFCTTPYCQLVRKPLDLRHLESFPVGPVNFTSRIVLQYRCQTSIHDGDYPIVIFHEPAVAKVKSRTTPQTCVGSWLLVRTSSGYDSAI